MRSSQPRQTLVSLAHDLGVSRATVSNAYNHPEQLSKELRARILARAAQLGFPGPDPMGRLLRGARIGAVGVLVDQGVSYAFSDPAAALLLDGLAGELQTEGFGLLVHAGLAGEAQLRHIRDAAVDAWVVLSLPDDDPAIDAALARGRPMVVLDQPAFDGVALVSIEDRAGTELATRHLLYLGHRRFGVLAMPLLPDGRHGPAGRLRQDATRYRVMRERLAGVRETLAAVGIGWDQVPVMECASNDPDAGARATTQLMAAHPGLTAIVALSDQLALGALRAAQELDLHVPDQISVVGFDDAPPAEHAYPPLTTIAQPIREKGRATGEHLRALLRGESPTWPAPYPVELVARGSTAPTPW
jgi:DNA-binding LacI/PurR family transcriptional regulator